MGRKHKKKSWWHFGKDKQEEQKNQTLFSNTIEQHKKRLNSHYNEDGNLVDDDEEYYHGGRVASWNYDWGLEQKLTDDRKSRGGMSSYEYARDAFKGYSTGSVWRGYDYYRPPQLGYQYVRQMANALSAKYRITVKVGKKWESDLAKKQLTYNPASLIYGTKSELLSKLLHEIGKLSYCDHNSLLTSNYLTFYRKVAVETMSIFEGVRSDFWVLKDYESAAEIYDSAIKGIDETIDKYRQADALFREMLPNELKHVLSKVREGFKNDRAQFETALVKTFGISDEQKIVDKINKVEDDSKVRGSIFSYCAEMLRVMYDTENFATDEFENIQEKVKLTEDYIEKGKKMNSSQKLVSLLDEGVFPVIEDLLKDFTKENEQINLQFPDMPEDIRQAIQNNLENDLNYNKESFEVNVDENGNMFIRGGSGPSDNDIPPEWEKGEYKPLHESVEQEIKQLVSLLTFIRREEMAVRYQSDQKRGRLNSRKLYKASTGSRRLFKEKLPNLDTVQSFAFSVLVDTSGSMGGARIVHSTRACIIFAEVFKKLSVPFEIVAFDSGARTIKEFSEELTREKADDIAGMSLPSRLGGSTNLHHGLDGLKILGRTEKNKVVIVLSDGGVGDIEHYNQEYFQKWRKQGVVSVGFGIECEEEMKKLCEGNSTILEDAGTLPTEFTNLLRTLIKKK